MGGRLSQRGRRRLEGLCDDASRDGPRARGLIGIGRGCDGIERLEARLAGQAFAPHRHDTYAIGITLSGVQTFRYRGAQRHCLPGQCHILHPDELHDGAAATDAGFSYRIIYIDPALIQEALGGEPLPFVADPVVRPDLFHDDLLGALDDLQSPIDATGCVEIAVAAAATLVTASGNVPTRPGRLRLSSLARVRALIAAEPTIRYPIEVLERESGLDRWSLARQFRAAFGTSPTRFRTMRQLDLARRMIRSGTSLAETATSVGFADQSHLSRMFKRTYGLTPAKWAAALI